MDYRVEQLKRLYSVNSKHSQYQRLASCLEKYIDTEDMTIGSMYERERLDFIKDSIELGESVIDIGGNSGYFTFECLTSGVKKVEYWEGNTQHAEFVDTAAKIVGYEDRIDIHNAYYDFDNYTGSADTIILLNVIHHLGYDFGGGIELDTAKTEMLRCINQMAGSGNKMVFQMGYNWGGDISQPLFKKGIKKEIIDFISEGTKGWWEIERIGIAVKNEGGYIYEDASAENLQRFDIYGEFLNRPLLIMKSKR